MGKPTTVTLSDLENFLSSRRYANGGLVDKVVRYAASKADGVLQRPFNVHKTPFAAEAEYNLPGASRALRNLELTPEEAKAYEGMSVIPLLMDPRVEQSTLRGDAINRITGEKFAKGGYVQPYTHMRSSTQTKSIDQMDSEAGSALKRGVQRWVPDLVALPGDLADAVAYAGRKIAQGQSERAVPSLGAGSALRRYAMSRMGVAQPAPTQPEIRETPETDWREEAIALANPLMFMNPKNLLSNPAVMGVAGVASGMPMGALGVIKNKGGNWLTGSVEDALGGLKSPYVKGYQEAVERYGPETAHHYAARPPVGAGDLNNWIDKQLTRYIKNEMATPEDPIRALAERGVLHFAPDWVPEGGLSRGQAAGLTGGKAGQRLGKSRLAQDWEDLTDQGLNQFRADELSNAKYTENPWLTKLARDTPVYEMPRQLEESLGFSHLTDELANALNPDSGLPRHLLLDPKSMDRVSVPQAVERVAAINAWRAAQKAEADALRANNAATVLHKDYPDKGFKWVELRKQDLPEGWVQEGAAYANPADPKAKWIYPEESLKDALKYEGDTMGHCVGGYCDDVASGRTKIYSLRDAKGQPHVTIEVGKADPRAIEREMRRVDPQLADDWEERLMSDKPFSSTGHTNQLLEFLEDYDYPELDKFINTQSIKQIKGKQNRAPNEEYLPFVQDFVRSGQWSDVGDLQNAGLRRSRDVWNALEQERIRAAGQEFGDFIDAESINRINKAVWSDDPAYAVQVPKQTYAHGGAVDKNNPLSVEQLSAIIQQLRTGTTNG